VSADRWAKCPKCTKKLQDTLNSSYGKVSEDEYLDALRQVNEQDETMREDYSIWTEQDGAFKVEYSCSCSVCGFKFTYKYQQQLLPQND
jgi:transposase-like protein